LPNSKISRTTPETQAKSGWLPPSGPLGDLTRAARERSRLIDVAGFTAPHPTVRSLESALRGPNVGVIAEVKRRSPSKGEINSSIDSGAQARAYADGGAAAISILTEPKKFGGSLDDMYRARSSTGVPLLKKDFHVSEAQLLEARSAGASAALIIIRALPPAEVEALAKAARDIGLEILFEVRDERELDVALTAGARMIGVNNRNLETLEIDPATVERLIPLVPPDLIAVAESGYSSVAAVERAASAGADAVLIGSHLSSAADPAGAVRMLASVRKRSRGSVS
jgi:indole-3-glycerol phosphate synthase